MSIQSSSSRNSKTHADDATATRTKALFLSLFLSSFDSSLERKTRGGQQSEENEISISNSCSFAEIPKKRGKDRRKKTDYLEKKTDDGFFLRKKKLKCEKKKGKTTAQK